MYQDERKLDFKPLGIAIKKAREAKGWTQEYLAQLVDLTPRSIMYIENAYAAPTVQPDRRRWCIVTAGMVHGDRRCGAPGRHAENYSGMPLRLRMDSPSIWMV